MESIGITGAGIVSAIGIGKAATLESLLRHQTGIGVLRYLGTEHKEFPVGEVPMSNDEMIEALNINPQSATTRTSLMGMMALREALAEARIDAEMLHAVGLISGTTVGGMDKSEQYYLDFLENNNRNEYISTHDCGASTEMIADHFGTFSFVTTLSTACSSAANAVILGAEKIRSGEAEIVIVGGSECITKFHLNGFNSLMILDKEQCRPFDATRAGLNLGEGAAYLVLESRSSYERRGVTPLAYLSGYGNACDAFHQTASSPDGEGAFRAMQEALQKGMVNPWEVDYINAHGTGTQNNDESEGRAMRRLFGDALPPVSSTKSFTGHTTSASGSIEAVICLLAMQKGFLPVNLNWKVPMDTGVLPIPPNNANTEKVSLQRVLCNSFGFGGNDSSLLLTATPNSTTQQLNNSTVQQFNNSTTQQLNNSTVYVTAAKQISMQQPLSETWMTDPIYYHDSYVRSLAPDFKKYVSSIEARRMGNILKRALATSQEALHAAGLSQSDVCVTGTGLGCIENTELFLDALCREGEQLLKPTYFMQSTHNTISSLIAIKNKAHGYNATYAHKGVSFDSALQDAWLQLQLGEAQNALVGAHDEMTPSYFKLLQKSGYLGQANEIAGETSVSIVLATDAEAVKPLCRMAGFQMCYRPSLCHIAKILDLMLLSAGIDKSQLSGVVTGISGNPANDQPYIEELAELLPGCPLLKYKHLFGESYTASGLAFYVAATCLDQELIPRHLYVEPSNAEPHRPQALLLYNRSDGKNYSFTILVKSEK